MYSSVIPSHEVIQDVSSVVVFYSCSPGQQQQVSSALPYHYSEVLTGRSSLQIGWEAHLAVTGNAPQGFFIRLQPCSWQKHSLMPPPTALKYSEFCPHCVFMCLVWLSQQTESVLMSLRPGYASKRNVSRCYVFTWCQTKSGAVRMLASWYQNQYNNHETTAERIKVSV